mmetsp:Transcript_23767/g.74810  ORF Transcript_23767/g.74810 Transcript_23767/m.74810 type:complete len:352 (+) Transcript_23767:1875-2930(+)
MRAARVHDRRLCERPKAAAAAARHEAREGAAAAAGDRDGAHHGLPVHHVHRHHPVHVLLLLRHHRHAAVPGERPVALRLPALGAAHALPLRDAGGLDRRDVHQHLRLRPVSRHLRPRRHAQPAVVLRLHEPAEAAVLLRRLLPHLHRARRARAPDALRRRGHDVHGGGHREHEGCAGRREARARDHDQAQGHDAGAGGRVPEGVLRAGPRRRRERRARRARVRPQGHRQGGEQGGHGRAALAGRRGRQRRDRLRRVPRVHDPHEAGARAPGWHGARGGGRRGGGGQQGRRGAATTVPAERAGAADAPEHALARQDRARVLGEDRARGRRGRRRRHDGTGNHPLGSSRRLEA